MANIPRNASVDRGHNPRHVAPSPRAASLREQELRHDPDKRTERRDPVEAQRSAAEARAKEDPDAPRPQVGLSSSQLNTPTPAMKAAAEQQATVLPHNNMEDDERDKDQEDSKAAGEFQRQLDESKKLEEQANANKDDKKDDKK